MFRLEVLNRPLHHVSTFAAGLVLITLAYFTANGLYLAAISAFPLVSLYDNPVGMVLNASLIFITAHVFIKYWKGYVVYPINVGHAILVIPYLFIIALRFPILHPMADDVAGHYMLGEYARTLWTHHHFMSTHLATYFFPAVDMMYTPFLYAIGLRLTILLFYLVVSFWMISLYARFMEFMKSDIQKIGMTILFLILPYITHLIATHGTLMVDYIALAFTLEAFYQLIVKRDNYTFATFLVVLCVLVKQSTSIFFLPIFAYYLFQKRQFIRWVPIIIFSACISIYFIRLQLETGNMLFGLYNGLFKSALYDAGNFRDTSFGPTNLIDSLLWPITGQFTDRFGQGYTTKLQRFFFSPLTIIGYLLPVIMMFYKRSVKYGLIFICYLMWIFMSGYSRYIIPLNIIIMIILLIDMTYPKVKLLTYRPAILCVLMVIWILAMSSLKTDFAWRPTLNIFTNRQNNIYLINGLKQGMGLVFKDSMNAYIDEQRPLFEPYDAIVPVYRGDATFLAFLGAKKGIPIIKALSVYEKKAVLSDNKISHHIKQNLLQLDSMERVIVLVERSQEQIHYVDRDLDVKRNFKCSRVGQYKQSRYFQAAYQFEEMVIYDCINKAKTI